MLAHEGHRVLEVVEHRDRGDGVEGPALRELVQPLRREGVLHDGVVALRLLRHVRGVDPELRERARVVPEQRAVVAPDVEHPGVASADHRGGLVGDALQVVAHRAVRARPVPVGGVEDRGRHRVLHLQQPARLLVAARIAAHQDRRDPAHRRQLLPGLHERALEVLLAEVDHLGERGGAADATRRSVDEVHGSSRWRADADMGPRVRQAPAAGPGAAAHTPRRRATQRAIHVEPSPCARSYSSRRAPRATRRQ